MNKFKAATWNIYSGTDIDKTRGVFHDLIERGVSVIFAQEAWGADLTRLFNTKGFKSYVAGQYRVAWDGDLWLPTHKEFIRLAREPYYAKGSSKPIYSSAARVILNDTEGQSLDALSIHFAPYVQQGDAPENRVTSTVQSIKKLERLAAASKTNAFIAAGDTNYDPSARLAKFRVQHALRAVNDTMRWVSAPSPTHDIRSIDNFIIERHLLRVGKNGEVLPGGGDHKVHVREFTWR